jgi:hypothetical protein
MNDLFEKIIGAEVQGRGVKISHEGEFTIQNKAIIVDESKDDLGLLWIIEFEIVTSSIPDLEPVGATRSIAYWPMTNRTHPGCIKEHILASFGISNDAMKSVPISRDQMREIVDDGLICEYVVNLQTKNKTGKTSGKPYTMHIWSPHTPGTSGGAVVLGS